MNKIKLMLLVMMAVCCLHPSFAQTQPQTPESKKAAELKRLETAVGTAKAGLNMAEKKAATADSLLNVGPELIKQGKADEKQAGNEISARDKEYKAKVKELDRKMKSKDKNEAAEARKDRKNVDTQYRADLKELTTKQRDALKKISTGENNKNRGKASQKTSREAVKRAEVTLNAAQAKLDAAKGGDKPVNTKKKR
ncbi:MAG TPA: hypothetical protein VGK38_08430 [Prolixibacteraceae bacterium]